mgnify:CR=1 FL=1
MVTALLDTSIVVDLMRKYPPADDWLKEQTGLGITRMVWLEIVEGALNRVEQQRAIRLLRDFELVEITNEDAEWATIQLIAFRLSHDIDAIDCLIAATSHRLNIPLMTHNLKHFTPLLGSLAQKPY